MDKKEQEGKSGVKICIRRAANAIGGNCVEITAPGGERVVLDIGLPLDAENNEASLLPGVPGLTGRTPDLLAVVVSHPHQDHYGLGKHIDPSIPVYMGAAANRIMRACAEFGLPGAFAFENVQEMRNAEAFQLGPFTVTPYLVDHSAYDAYSLLVEVGGRRIFYSGDFRAHGRKNALFDRLAADPPRDVDVLLMEGSSLGRLDADAKFPSEASLEARFCEAFEATPGLALVHPSSQNIDRVVTIYKAAKKFRRTLVMSGYTGRILMVLENPRIPNFKRWNVKKLVAAPSGQGHEITAAKIAENPGRFVYLVGGKTLRLIEGAGLLTPDARYIYSMWSGYKETWAAWLIDKMKAAGVPVSDIHTSGHADIPTLLRLVQALRPARLVPIHTHEPERFSGLFGAEATVERHDDNETWAI